MTARALLVLSFSLAGAAAVAQEPTIDALSALVERHRDPERPGGVLVATRDGVDVHAAAFGCLTVDEAPAAVHLDSRFYVASTAKMFTAACVHSLAVAGRLDLDDPVERHVPELEGAATGVTLRHMLHHRSGIRDFYELGLLLGWDLMRPPPRDEVLALLGRQRGLCFEPGRDAGYSNSNYLLLALVVERVAERPFPTFAREVLFEPLGMERTAFGRPAVDAPAVATGHVVERGAFAPRVVENDLVGAGGAWSTARDLCRFARVFSDDRYRELGAALTRSLELTPDQWLHPRLGDYRAGTMARSIGDATVYHHSGGYLGSQAELIVAPEHGVVVAGVCNRGDLDWSGLCFDAVAALGVGAATPSDAAAPDGAKPLGGRWLLRDERRGGIGLLVTRGADGRLQGLDLDLRLLPVERTRWRARGTRFPIDVVLADDARTVEMRTPGKDARRFTVIEAKPFAAADADAAAGVYASDELDTELELVAQRGQLALRDRGFSVPIPPFRALARDVLVSPGRVLIVVELSRDDEGRVDGFVLGTNRARGLRFRRR